MRNGVVALALCAVCVGSGISVLGQQRPRARDLGIPFEGSPGPLNSITDIPAIEVGYATLQRGEGALRKGQGPVRTGVTAILPRGKANRDPVFGAWFTLNAAGEMTGTTWLEERGFLEGPILITNTHSVGIVRDAAIDWMLRNSWTFRWITPVVAETYDGDLNDINGFHVTKEHAFAALNNAKSGAIAEGNVGGGTGMVCHQFKGGTGTASRRVAIQSGIYTVGVLVQCNYGSRAQLRVAGVPVGAEIRDLLPCFVPTSGASEKRSGERCAEGRTGRRYSGAPDDLAVTSTADTAGDGSIIIVVATDAPVLPHQLQRLAKRAALGIGRMGGTATNGSGDIFVAFATANASADIEGIANVKMLGNVQLTSLFEAAVQATEEAITNTLVAAETMTGADGFRVFALPHARLQAVMRKYNRLVKPR
jgi:L-aminopeptidase/D-esterase-like protein